MSEVALQDSRRIGAHGGRRCGRFLGPGPTRHDELKWCGSSPVYTFLKCVPEAKGALQRYEQWNIDEESVVSFAGMTFKD